MDSLQESSSRRVRSCSFDVCLPHNPGLSNWGFPVPYLLASDGRFFFSFLATTKLVVGETNFTRKAIMTLAFLC